VYVDVYVYDVDVYVYDVDVYVYDVDVYMCVVVCMLMYTHMLK